MERLFLNVACGVRKERVGHEPRHRVVVVIADSKGRERFRRPLRKNSNAPAELRSSLLFLGTCCSSFGAGVPVEAKWRWFWHVLAPPVSVCRHTVAVLDSSSGLASRLLRCAHNTTFWLRHQTAPLFSSPTHRFPLLYFILPVTYLYSPNQKIRGIRNADFCCC